MMTAIGRMLHDKGSQLMDMLMRALSLGKLCVVDVSQMRGGQALVLSDTQLAGAQASVEATRQN